MNRRSVNTLRRLCKAVGRARSKLLNSRKVQALIREVAYNLLRGSVNLRAEEKRRLRPYAEKIRSLAHGKTGHRRRVNITEQTGGLLPALLGPALGALTGILGRALLAR